MIKNFFTVLGVVLSASAFGQANFWKVSNNFSAKNLKARTTQPTKFKSYALDLEGLKSSLKNAPQRASSDESLVLKFPDADGKFKDYVVQEASVMAPSLQAKYSEIRSYVGWEKGKSGNSIRFSVSPFEGINVMYFNGNEVSYLDDYTTDLSTYIVYKRADLQNNPERFNCYVQDEGPSTGIEKVDVPMPIVTDGQMRTYRLALACTIEYAAFHVNRANMQNGTLEQKKAAVMSAFQASMTRVNGVYEKSLSLTMVMVENNDKLIFIDSDEYDNQNSPPNYPLLEQNQTVTDREIGNANYDIGHVFSTASGGVASLRSPCVQNSKARGTTGTSNPINDGFNIDYVAHEIGHQFGATHTFNNSCSGNRSNATAVEPGSGSTIMGYAGICSPNVQNFSDPYFHSVSVNQMFNYIRVGVGSCAVGVGNGNQAPTIGDLPITYNIPNGTAFELTAEATDLDGDALTYLWEQTDNQIATMPPVSTSVQGPTFRSLAPTESNTRVFPPMANVWTNNLKPANLVVPTVARTLNFSLLVNDNKAIGNQTARKATRVITAATGPFAITSQNTSGLQFGAEVPMTITWDLAGSNAAPINTEFVTITMSKGGNAASPFDVVLAENVPNNGSAVVNLPNEDIAAARIKIKAVNNVYFAINRNTFKVNKFLAVNDVDKKAFSIYPNPAKGEVNVNLVNKSSKAEYVIYDNSGRLIKSGKLSDTSKVNISSLKAGVYRFVVTNNGVVDSQNLIVK